MVVSAHVAFTVWTGLPPSDYNTSNKPVQTGRWLA